MSDPRDGGALQESKPTVAVTIVVAASTLPTRPTRDFRPPEKISGNPYQKVTSASPTKRGFLALEAALMANSGVLAQ
jgi:hypothetical protein